jgi:hypothetical protein
VGGSVELFCKPENVVIASVKVDKLIDEAAVLSAEVLDRRRMPIAKEIKNGATLTCGRCAEPLWFRAADGRSFVAVPGSLEVA